MSILIEGQIVEKTLEPAKANEVATQALDPQKVRRPNAEYFVFLGPLADEYFARLFWGSQRSVCDCAECRRERQIQAWSRQVQEAAADLMREWALMDEFACPKKIKRTAQWKRERNPYYPGRQR